MDVELITDRNRFAAMEPIWNDVLARSGVNHPFVTHEWISAWWDNFQPSGTPYILAVREGSRIVAIAPLMLEHGTMFGCSIRRLRGMGNVYSERFELLLGERPQESSEALWKYLAAHADRWDVLELRQLPAESQTLTFLTGLAERNRCSVGCWPSTESPYVAIRDSWDAYHKSLKKVHRADMRKRMASLEQLGPVELDIVTSDHDIEKDFGDALRLESSAWKGAQGSAIESRDDSKEFYRNVLTLAAQSGWLQLYFLMVAGKRIAVRIGLFFHNRLYMLKSGYDPDYAAYSPSHLLCDKMLREAWNLQFTEADFLGNSERWKLSWSTNVRPHCWLFVFPRRPMPWLLYNLKFRLQPRIQRTPLYATFRSAAARFGITSNDA